MTDQLYSVENDKVKKLDFSKIRSTAFIWLCSDDETVKTHFATALEHLSIITTKKHEARPTFDPKFLPPGQLQMYPEIKLLDISVCLMVVPSDMWSTVESELKKILHQTKIAVMLSFDDRGMFTPTDDRITSIVSLRSDCPIKPPRVPLDVIYSDVFIQMERLYQEEQQANVRELVSFESDSLSPGAFLIHYLLL